LGDLLTVKEVVQRGLLLWLGGGLGKLALVVGEVSPECLFKDGGDPR